MSTDLSQFYQLFFEEAAEHLASMENLLLGLDTNAPSLDELNAIFRSAHSIKGSSGMFGFNDMMSVTHELETLLDRLRKQELALTSGMVDVFLEARDVIKAQLDAHQSGCDPDLARAATVCGRIKALAAGESEPVAVPVAPAAVVAEAPAARAPAAPAVVRRLDISFATTGTEVTRETVLETSRLLGDASVVRDAPGAPWRITLATVASDAEVREALGFLAAPDAIQVAAAAETSDDGSFGLFGDVPVAAPETEPAAQHAEAPVQAHAGEHGDEAGVKFGRRAEDKMSAESSSIRVSVEKVDKLINLVGELVITQAMLAQMSNKVDPVLYETLLNGLGQLERSTRDLQDAVMSIRMMPISFVFNRFPRVVRDLAGKLGKQAELKTVGEGTELDKGLIEKITDPLTHLVRNSIDHGIESPADRVAAGKSEKGTITLRAFHQGGNVIIEVSDDGRGLDRSKILAKARERGMAAPDTMTDAEVWHLIFEAGFSTADAITDVSGRGVGMDVVKRNIHALGGRVEIDTTTGAGTRITIRLPLTLAILDGLSVAVGSELFIVPLTYIVESLQPHAVEVKTVSGRGRVIHVRGEYLPLIALHEVFNLKPRVKDIERGIVVILETEGRKTAIVVDELVGQHQVVIKSLETNYRRVHGVSGATIMGDGKVALILDPVAIAREAVATAVQAA
jgi:two-component system, chemotaxis family, sensor kinase CheA